MLEATLHELAEAGYGGLSMDRVASRAGVSKATIYRRWPSREALIVDAWRSIDNDSKDAIDTGSLRGDLLTMLDQYRCEFSLGPVVSLLPQVVAGVYQSPQLKDLFTAFVIERNQPVVDVFIRAAERGELRREVSPERAADLLFGVIFSQLLLRGSLLSADELEASIDIVLNGSLPS